MLKIFWIFGVKKSWLEHTAYLETKHPIDFFRCRRWKLVLSIGKLGIYIRVR